MEKKPSSPIAFTLVGTVSSLVFWRNAAAVLSGLLLSAAYPPLCWDLLAWVALTPLIFAPQPRAWRQRLFTGYLFGYTHCASSLLWLNEVGFGAGWLLAAYCALYPMLWYALLCALLDRLKDLRADHLPGASLLYIASPVRLALVAVAGAAAWTALEWLRATLLTGFPWNQLGISQFQRTGLIQLAAWTGVYGVSFIVAFTNLALAVEATHIAWMLLARRRHPCPWHFAILAALLVPVAIAANLPHTLPRPDTPSFDALVVQGNLPQQRIWSDDILDTSLDTYTRLTREAFDAAPDPKPTLVVWPEAAIPAPLNYERYRLPRNAFMRTFPPQTQFLVGAIHHRLNPDGPPDDVRVFNTAFLLDPALTAADRLFNPADHIADYYDKIHCVPFGEYTPLGHLFPWLRDLIGMGRDLTPGKSYHPLALRNGLRLGVNICFEDVFPDISRQLTLNGAQLLSTITNDSWYNQSAGAFQHMSHVVFRAVENRRPFLRAGSNSHTCYITPNGVISPFLRDNRGDSDFIAAAQVYELPIHTPAELGTTFYTRHGDVFARAALLVTLICCAWLLKSGLDRRRQNLLTLKEACRNAQNGDAHPTTRQPTPSQTKRP